MNDTPGRLIEATRACINDRGVAATTSRDIAAAAEANLGAITYHFGSKDQLVADALLATLREWLEPTLAVLRDDSEPTTRTMLAIQTLLTTFESRRHEVGVYLEALVHAQRDDAVRAGLIELWNELGELASTHVSDMKERGEIPAWVDPNAMGSVLIGVANGLLLQVRIDPAGPSLPTMAGQFGSLLLEARQPPSAPMSATS
jgi:AcrR family transcriptional regulator